MKKNLENTNIENLPFANEIKKAKYGFKKMIDEMPDDEFVDFIMMFIDFVEDIDDDDFDDDEDLPF